MLATGLLAGPAQADDKGSTPNDDPAAQAQVRKEQRASPPRKQALSRRAKRARVDTASPLALTIDNLTPSTIPEKGMVRVSGTITNNDTVTWSTINVYAFISETPLTTPEQLDEAAATPEDAVVGGRITDERHKVNIEELAPGDHATYSLSIPRRLLQVSTPGVYWFGVHALGEGPEGRDLSADGRARTFLPLVPPNRVGQQPTAVVIPLRHQLVYTDEGSLDDLASWTKTLSQGGRLRSLVDFGANSGDRTVSWVVDPALIDAVRRLANGNPPRSLAANLQVGQEDGEDETPEDASASSTPTEQPTETPTAEPEESDADSPLDLDELDPVVQAAAQAAQAWLARLGEAMRPEDQVMSLPYGDVDVAAAAEHDPQLYERAVARAGTTLPGFDVTTTPVVSSPSGFLNTQGIRGPSRDRRSCSPTRCSRTRPRRSPTPRATTWWSRRPPPARAAPARAAVRRSPRCGSACCRRPRSGSSVATRHRSPWWSPTTGTRPTGAVRSSAGSTRAGWTSPRCRA